MVLVLNRSEQKPQKPKAAFLLLQLPCGSNDTDRDRNKSTNLKVNSYFFLLDYTAGLIFPLPQDTLTDLNCTSLQFLLSLMNDFIGCIFLVINIWNSIFSDSASNRRHQHHALRKQNIEFNMCFSRLNLYKLY